MQQRVQQRCPLRPSAAVIRPRLSSRSARVAVNAQLVEFSKRVPGDLRTVFSYAANATTRPAWVPGVSEVLVTRGGGEVAPGMKYLVKSTLGGLVDLDTTYEVVEVQREKRVVYSAASKLHTATEQLVFMADPADRNYTVVRYIMKVELSDWKRALQPILSGLLGKVPENALSSLAKLLGGPDSPLPKLRGASPKWSNAPSSGSTRTKVGQQQQQQQQGSTRVRAGQQHQQASTSYASASGSMDEAAHAARNWAGSLFGGAGGFFKQASPSKAAAAPPPPPREGDMYGFYEALGLEPGAQADSIKSAFRKAAQRMHPDKFSTADDDEREEVQAAFVKVTKAYEVLRDPDQRRLYDSGKLKLEENDPSQQYQNA